MASVRRNLETICSRMAAAARRTGREPQAVRLVAVSKKVGADRIRQAVAAGQRLFGENYLQEAMEKMTGFGPEVSWHFIGHLQSNKAGDAARYFSCVETVDRLKLAKVLDARAAALGRLLPILVQLNIGREPQKSGVMPEEAGKLLASLGKLSHLEVKGLMAMPPFLEDPEAVRPYFRRTRQLAESLAAQGLLPEMGSCELSMGMSGDFEVAIEEGATLVRVGTALFGERG